MASPPANSPSPRRPASLLRAAIVCLFAAGLIGTAGARRAPRPATVADAARHGARAGWEPVLPAAVAAEPVVVTTPLASGGILAALPDESDEGATPAGYREPATDRAEELLRADATAAAPPPAPVRVVWVVRMQVTAYCPCPKCCGPAARGVTASGLPVSYDAGRFVAADTRLLPFGTRLQIPGYHGGRAVEVIDRGGAIKGRKLDVYFPTHEQAREWGRRWVDVSVVE